MRWAMPALAALAVLAAPGPAAAQDAEIVVRGDAARVEIERILEADNVDTMRLAPRQVADLIAAIPRGRAPDDCWTAYRAHVAAWRRLAAARDAEGRTKDEEAVASAEAAIEATFDEVERIARAYGARLPTPPYQPPPRVAQPPPTKVTIS